jgi:hypothetical protein
MSLSSETATLMYSKRVKLRSLLRQPAFCPPRAASRTQCPFITSAGRPNFSPELSSSNPELWPETQELARGDETLAALFSLSLPLSLSLSLSLSLCLSRKWPALSLTEDPLGVCLQIDRRLLSLIYSVVSLCTKCRIRSADGLRMYATREQIKVNQDQCTVHSNYNKFAGHKSRWKNTVLNFRILGRS